MKTALIRKFTEAYGCAPTVVARAPGRIEFIGNHTDYNGGTVLGAAIDRGVWVAAAPDVHGSLSFVSDYAPSVVKVSAANPVRQTGATSWVNYPLGVWVNMPGFSLKRPAGFRMAVASDLPSGAGLSSSAALELSSALAFISLTGENPDRETLVKLCKKAENDFVGVPCGILDQSVSGFGKKNHLVFIDCRGPKFATVELPEGTHFWVFNTHTKHALVDGMFAARHRECMEAAKLLGVSQLVDATLPLLEAKKALLSPAAYHRARHVIEEIARVATVCEALSRTDLRAVGTQLTASHRSSQHQFENSTPELDFLVDALVANSAVFGARLTGGGFGGAVMAMTDGQFTATMAAQACTAYKTRFGEAPEFFNLKASDGAEILGA